MYSDKKSIIREAPYLDREQVHLIRNIIVSIQTGTYYVSFEEGNYW